MQMFAWKHGGTGNDPKRKQHKEHSLVEWLKRVDILIYIFFGIYSHSDIPFVVMYIHFLECSIFFQWLWPTWNAFLKRGLLRKMTVTQLAFHQYFNLQPHKKNTNMFVWSGGWRLILRAGSCVLVFFFVFSCRKHFAWSSESSAGQQLMSQQWRRARLRHFPG